MTQQTNQLERCPIPGPLLRERWGQEPWKVEDGISEPDYRFIEDATGEQVAMTSGYDYIGQEHANANRIVACINACRGMKDPESEIRWLRSKAKGLI
jgi:hypothetical protein